MYTMRLRCRIVVDDIVEVVDALEEPLMHVLNVGGVLLALDGPAHKLAHDGALIELGKVALQLSPTLLDEFTLHGVPLLLEQGDEAMAAKETGEEGIDTAIITATMTVRIGTENQFLIIVVIVVTCHHGTPINPFPNA